MVEKLQASRSRGAGVLCVVRPSAATPTDCRASLGADPHGKNRLVCQFAQLPMNWWGVLPLSPWALRARCGALPTPT